MDANYLYQVDLESQFNRDKVPQVVRDAVRSYQAPPGYAVARKAKVNTSIAFSWGVRLVEVDKPTQFWWVCLASDICRMRQNRINMMKGKTSKVTEHLKALHGISSYKTDVTETSKRARNDLMAKYQNSDLYQQQPARFMVLLETLKVIRNNLAFSSVETQESELLRSLCYKEAHQTTLNAKTVHHSLVELYACGKREIQGLINAARGEHGGYFSIVTDFWTSDVQSKKYIGVRLYMVDTLYTFRSFLLGTRQFDPPFGDRNRSCDNCLEAEIDPCPHAQHKIRYPFRRWITNILRDYDIKRRDLFGATSDSGSDVKWMMSRGFTLNWEWCIAHLSHAATKHACGLVDNPSKSKNKPMTKLHKAITTTIYQTKHIEVMGSLFAELCGSLAEDGSVQLLNYRSHRFLGLTRVIERIMLKWESLKRWYDSRATKARIERAQVIPEFPLDGHKRDLIQLLCLLKPIAANNASAQAEGPVQVKVLVGLFKLRLFTFNPNEPLRDYRSLPPTPSLITPPPPRFFQVLELTTLVKHTRQLLCDAFHVRYFRRNTDTNEMKRCSYVFEMQLALHPDYKDLDMSLKPVVLLSNEQYGIEGGNHEGVYRTVVELIDKKIVNELVKKSWSTAISGNRTSESSSPN